MLPQIACPTGVKTVLSPFFPHHYVLLIGLHLIASQVVGPSVWPIPSVEVLADMNKASLHHCSTSHCSIISKVSSF